MRNLLNSNVDKQLNPTADRLTLVTPFRNSLCRYYSRTTTCEKHITQGELDPKRNCRRTGVNQWMKNKRGKSFRR